MRVRSASLVATVVMIGLGLALPAFGQSDGSGFIVNFSTPNNPVIFGDGYADPYNGTVTYNGGSSINPNGLIVCDDYKDNISENTHWDATGIQASTLNSSNLANTMFASIGLVGYAEVANLVSQMFSTTNQQQRGDLSAAIWWITSGGTVTKNGVNSIYSIGGVTLDANAVALLQGVLGMNSATLLSALKNDTNLWILTPSDWGTNNGPPQEMWISTPEGGAALMFLLFAGLSCFGAMFFKYRSEAGGQRVA